MSGDRGNGSTVWAAPIVARHQTLREWRPDEQVSAVGVQTLRCEFNTTETAGPDGFG